MASNVNSIPEGYSSVAPYLICSGANKVLEFLQKTFSVQVLDEHKSPEGTIMHASLKIGNGTVMLSEEAGNFPPMPCMVHVYVENCDETYKRAIEAGAESIREPKDEFYGDRSSGVKDISGNQWWISTHVENVSPEEMEKRMKEWEKNRNPDRSGTE